MTALPNIRVDFSNEREDGLVFAIQEAASRPLQEGDEVHAFDGEGGHCLGRVARVGNGLVYLALDSSTWTDEDDEDSVTTTHGGLLDVFEWHTRSPGNGSTRSKSRSEPPRVKLLN